VPGTGFDIVDIRRITGWAARYDMPVLATVFTPRELALQTTSLWPVALAICFCAKEALIKALGMNIGLAQLDLIEVGIAGQVLRVCLRENEKLTVAHGCWRLLPDERLATALILDEWVRCEQLFSEDTNNR